MRGRTITSTVSWSGIADDSNEGELWGVEGGGQNLNISCNVPGAGASATIHMFNPFPLHDPDPPPAGGVVHIKLVLPGDVIEDEITFDGLSLSLGGSLTVTVKTRDVEGSGLSNLDAVQDPSTYTDRVFYDPGGGGLPDSPTSRGYGRYELIEHVSATWSFGGASVSGDVTPKNFEMAYDFGASFSGGNIPESSSGNITFSISSDLPLPADLNLSNTSSDNAVSLTGNSGSASWGIEGLVPEMGASYTALYRWQLKSHFKIDTNSDTFVHGLTWQNHSIDNIPFNAVFPNLSDNGVLSDTRKAYSGFIAWGTGDNNDSQNYSDIMPLCRVFLTHPDEDHGGYGDWWLSPLAVAWDALKVKAQSTIALTINSWAYDAATITQSGNSFRVTDGHTAVLTFYGPFRIAPYGYIRVKCSVDGSDSQPIQVAINDKSWNGLVLTSPTNLELHTISPHNKRGVFAEDITFPYAASGQPPVTEDGGWGIYSADNIQFTLQGGHTYTFSGIELFIKEYAKISFITPYGFWPLLYPTVFGENQETTTYVQPLCRLDFDGKWTDLYGAVHEHVRNLISDTVIDSYTKLSIAQVALLLNGAVGITATVLGAPTPMWDPNEIEAMALGAGNGFTVQNGTLQWVVDLDLMGEATVKAQAQCSEIGVYPEMGDFSTIDGAYGPIQIHVVKNFRGVLEGYAFDDKSSPLPGLVVQDLGVANDIEGTGTTNGDGHFLTALPGQFYAPDPFNINIAKLLRKSNPHGAVETHIRWRSRAVFIQPSVSVLGLDYNVAVDNTRLRMYAMGDQSVKAGRNDLVLKTWDDIVSALTAEWVRFHVSKFAHQNALYIAYGDGSQVHLAQSANNGKTITNMVDIGVGIVGDIMVGNDNIIYVYVLQQNNTIKGILLDLQNNVQKTFTTDVNDADTDSSIAIHETGLAGGKWEMGLLYRSNGDIKFKTSSNGVNFI